MSVFPTLNMVYCTHLSGLLGHFPPHSLPFFLASPIPSISTGFLVLSRPTRVYNLLISKLGCMVTPCWGRVVAWLLPTGATGREGVLQGYFSLGKLVSWLLPTGVVDFRVSPRWGTEWVAWLLPAQGEVGCMVTPH